MFLLTLLCRKVVLTQDTKRKIDSARDILVGKVPDPKAQVEQITTALIYKFMDDMDKGSQELGGKTRFFTNGYEKYSWTKLMDLKLGGHDRMDLYVEALSKLSLNPNIPQLFRDIFKDAFLPYRSPETLSLFLKEINGFTYEHSEDLGDSFEYLLLVLGSQGDAGQFRTPRHIIDFIVAAIDPKKDDVICDPACGTAGFLISAYKHILRQHGGKDDPKNKEKPLTPDEKKQLMNHFVGYDISPDMVRLSRVNMYLHGFPNPIIYEYDTLSSEEKWDESFDVMLANPPFMTPKGGIKPHKRFSVQANRSEVLFVDYILEHLRPNGCAGIIVPEGIIFQSANAYKALRKLLVEDGLFAVVSLPQGVFNPYSGVKTGILLFDKALAKKNQNILFVKIENDGYGLGAQRREIDKNDLPQALEIIRKYKVELKNDKTFELNEDDKKIAHIVAKEAIAKSSDYNLSGDRYKEFIERTNQKWPVVGLGEISILVQRGKSPRYSNIGIQIIKSGQARGYFEFDFSKQYFVDNDFEVDHRKLENGDLLINSTGVGTAGRVTLFNLQGDYLVDSHITIVRLNKDIANPVFVLYVLANNYGFKAIEKMARGNGGQVELSLGTIKSLKIPLLPIEVQKEIVEQIEIKQQAIEHAKAIIKNLERERAYFGQSLRKLGNIEWVKLGEVCEINPKKSEISKLSANTEVSFVPMADIFENSMFFDVKQIKHLSSVSGSYTYFADNDVLLAKVTPCFENGKAGIARNLKNGIGFGSSEFIVLRASDRILPEILYGVISSNDFRELGKSLLTGTGGLQRIPPDFVRKFKIPLPSLEIQKQIVKEMEKEKEITTANRSLIGLMEQKIANILSEI